MRLQVTKHTTNLVIALLWLVLAVSVWTGLKSFTIWEQVVDLHDRDWTLRNLYFNRHPHFLRYVVAFPIFQASDMSGLSSNTIFNIACLLLLPALAVILRRISLIESQGVENTTRVSAILIAVFAISFFMNGRILYGLFGYSLLMLSFTRYFSNNHWNVLSFLACFFGTLLCSVSSGVFSVAFLFQVLCLLLATAKAIEKRRVDSALLGMALSIATTIVVFQEFLFIGIEKNIEFFGGGVGAVWTMLDHGIGVYIAVLNPYLLLLAVPMLIMATYISIDTVRRSTAIHATTSLALFSALVGGIFGLSTLSVGLIPALFLRPAMIARWVTTTGSASAASRFGRPG